VIRVTADTTIIVSGLTFPDGSPHEFLELARTGEIELALSDAILDEIADVLVRIFNWPDRDIQEARRQFGRFTHHVVPVEAIHAVIGDPDDNAVLACAVAAASTYIVSGERHLLQLGAFRSVPVLKVSAFLEVFRQGKGRRAD
jgi:putative PIN family toxin of toxin-antitoxin system